MGHGQETKKARVRHGEDLFAHKEAVVQRVKLLALWQDDAVLGMPQYVRFS